MEAKRLGLGNAVIFTGRVARADVPRYIRGARCSVSVIPPDERYVLSSPTKVVESLGMAVPVVANREIVDQAELIERSGGGLAVPYERQAVAHAILELLRDPSGSRARGQRGREYVVEERSYSRLSRTLLGELRQLLAGGVT